VLKDKAICIEKVKEKYKEDLAKPTKDRGSEIQWDIEVHK
jgi:hypothetical protein